MAKLRSGQCTDRCGRRFRPGTNSGRTFRLRGKGVRNTKTRAYGDHLYTVQIVVPKVVSPAGEETARRVADLYQSNPAKICPPTFEEQIRN